MLSFYTNVAVLALILAVSSLGLNALIGNSGIFSSAQATFYGVGAYAGAIVSIHVSADLFVALGTGIVVSGATALLLAITAVRIRGEYFVVASLAFAEIATTVMEQWTTVTGGNDGISGVPYATIGPLSITTANEFFVLALIVLAVVVGVFFVLLRRAPLGRMLRALSEDDLAVASLGHSPARLRTLIVVIAGMASGIGGVLYAYYVTYVDPSGFTINESVVFMTMIILGGAGSLWGAVIGSLVVEFGTASLNLLPFASSDVGPLQQIIVGLVLVLVMVFRPDGIQGGSLALIARIRRRPEPPEARAGGTITAGVAAGPAPDAAPPGAAHPEQSMGVSHDG